jgi:hypothetical protein
MASRHQQPPSRRGGGRGRSEPQTNARTAGEREGVSNAGEPVSANTIDRGPHVSTAGAPPSARTAGKSSGVSNAGEPVSANTSDRGPHANNAGGTLSASTIDEGPRASNAKKK